ncbi:DNA-processing protein DprA [Leeia oryzae]|uniref:DNA-processing protein DprA n=1 Tax=Leeia oryzae TaxID=356662 RepID=UPI00038103A5|nr:DNA-processing protein DprA [Leeia oryzae]
MTEHEAWLRLTLTPGLGPAYLLALLRQFGSPEDSLAQSELSLVRAVPAKVAKAIKQGIDEQWLAQHLQWLEDPANSLMTLADTDYPPQLLESPAPPPLLFVKGKRHLLSRTAIGVVGSRHATTSGMDNARAFSKALSDAGITVISGLAAGIDTTAHEGALSGPGSTIAVVGTGLDRVYPARNRDLAHKIAVSGAIVSEYPLGSEPLPGHFPQRNRIIAGLAKGCLVVEATLGSGSLITAKEALEAGRDVFAIPGSIHAPQSKGCHQLIKSGAKLVDDVADILSELPNLEHANLDQSSASSRQVDVAPALPAGLDFDPVDLDTLSLRSGVTMTALIGELLQLELSGWVESLPGGRYRRRK